MPNKDGTGPTGNGPMTGKGGGCCIISLNTKKEELQYLENREEALKFELTKTKSRIKKLNDKVNKE